ncbi:MAG: gliding motility-associated C-terminal domain-containing protein [Spirochaetales bacterium]|nr:gliding motility-associated C-terminal domain-containing protein [Spirochaetales bacterium]
MKNSARPAIGLAVMLLLLPMATFARGTPDAAPEIQLRSESGVHISPNGDGIQDGLQLSPVMGDGTVRAIKSFELTVFGTSEDLAGSIVWSRKEIQAESRGFFGDLLNIGDEPQVEIPDTLTWDGTYLSSEAGSDGTDVPDGEYIYQLSIIDESGATITTPPMNVSVDRQPPTIGEVKLSYTVFSPNGDQVRDDLGIGQDGSREVGWAGRITDSSGADVRTLRWDNAQPQLMAGDARPPDLRWDGADDDGSIVPDGTYSYTLYGTDRAGNTTASVPVSVIVSTRAGAVQLIPRLTSLSPNGDGSIDSITLETVVSEPDGLVSHSLSLAAVGLPDETLWMTEGLSPVPESFVFGGTDRHGRLLADGQYQLVLLVTYENGNSTESEPVTVTIDTNPPRGTVTARTGPRETDVGAPVVFGGTNKRYLDVSVLLSEESDWVAVATFGDEIYRVPLTDLGIIGTEFSFRWDGSDLAGNPLPDGLASLQFDTIDEAGNSGQTNQVRVIRDTRNASVSVAFLGEYLSPDGDGVNDSVQIETTYSVDDLLDQFLLSISDDRGRIIRTEYKRTPFAAFEWLGRTNGNTVVPDGDYFATLQVIYHNGNEPSARTGPITVDRTDPGILELSAPYRLFSPDGDGERDTVTIRQRTSIEDEWAGEITDNSGTVVFEKRWIGEGADFTWDGRGASGSVVPDGDYTYRITATDVAGNLGTEDLTLVVDTRSAPVSQQPPNVSISVGPLPFTPDGDGTNDRLTITAAAASENTLQRWELVISDPFGGEVRRWAGSGAPRRFISWDGRAPDGELVQSAQEYAATLTVTDDRGNTGSGSAVIAVGILVIRDGLTLRIMVPSIHFAPYTSDLFSVSSEDLQQNLETLRSLAAVLNRYSDHEILIEGHAAHDFYMEGPRKDREQIEELIPLSAARAEEVRQAMIILGVASERMRTIGIGGARPIVPHSDRDNLWKNRRVEFILERR